jgi:hypothetical protein
MMNHGRRACLTQRRETNQPRRVRWPKPEERRKSWRTPFYLSGATRRVDAPLPSEIDRRHPLASSRLVTNRCVRTLRRSLPPKNGNSAAKLKFNIRVRSSEYLPARLGQRSRRHRDALILVRSAQRMLGRTPSCAEQRAKQGSGSFAVLGWDERHSALRLHGQIPSAHSTSAGS